MTASMRWRVAGLDTRCPRFMRGWRKFCAQVLQESLKQAHFTGKFALRHNFEAGSGFSKRIRTQLDGGCCAWLWLHGQGSKDFTFSEVCEVVDFDPEEVLRAFHAPISGRGGHKQSGPMGATTLRFDWLFVGRGGQL